MKRKKPTREPNYAEVKEFSATAAKYQAASRCECPVASRQNAMIARKYLFYVIDELNVTG